MWTLNKDLMKTMIALAILFGCGQAQQQATVEHKVSLRKIEKPAPAIPPVELDQISARKPAAAPTAHRRWNDTDLISISEVDPTILIDLPFAHTDNPFHFKFFKKNEAFLRYGTARKLAAIQKDFMARGLRLKIWSAYRPLAVQVKMFELCPNGDWISDPNSGKRAHVRGVAVDCTLVDKAGRELAMPTPYLDFKHGAEKMKRDYMNLPAKVLANRNLLRSVIVAHGMNTYSGEWWHFQDKEMERYPVISTTDFPAIDQEILVNEMLAMEANKR